MRLPARVATAHEETAAFFDAAGSRLFGLLTRPTVKPLGVAVIMLTGGGIPSVSRNRLSVRFCRNIAALGCHALRFDYHGVGESEGEVDAFLLGEPFVEDLMGAVRWLRQQGINRFVLVGHCFGARTALSGAPEIDGLHGLALLSAPPRDFENMSLLDMARRAVRPRVLRGIGDSGLRRTYAGVVRAKWQELTARVRGPANGAISVLASARFLEPLAALAHREVPVLLLYGDEDRAWRLFQRAREGSLGELLEEGPPTTEVVTVAGRFHGFGRIDVQDVVIDTTIHWLGDRVLSKVVGK